MIAPLLSRGRREGLAVAKRKETFGTVLVRLREAAAMSQDELANRSGLTRQALWYLETGDREPSWDTVQRLAKALGLDCSAFENEGLELPEYKPGKPGPKPRGKKGGK